MLTQIQIACQTQFTKDGTRNMKNRKPFRTPSQKTLAKKNAYIGIDGAWHSGSPVSYHR